MKFELFKLGKERSFWVIISLLAAFGVFYPLLILTGPETETVTVQDLFTQIGLGGNNYITRIAPVILAGFFISSEYSMGTMKSMVASGNNRLRIYLAKLGVFAFGAVLISLAFPVVLAGAGAVFFQFDGMPALGYFIRTLAFISLYAAAFASIMSLFSIIFTDSGKSIGFLIIFFLLFDSILYALAMKFSVFEMIFNNSIFSLLLDIGNNELSGSELAKLTIVPIATFIVFSILGSLIFQRKEIK